MNHEEQQFFKDIDVRPSNTVGRLRSEDKPSDCIHAVRGWVDRRHVPEPDWAGL